ncbi:MAG: hypothetical protein HYX65_03820 [Gemmatimonadetes bacterium]|nr:hypothetical protein [Gemmatimonadota bacterium]
MSGHRAATRLAVSGAATAAALVLLARASAAPVPWHAGDVARLRLSWSARPERIEVCRTRSAEEIAKMPEHMRQRTECEGRFASYALRVTVDGQVAGEAEVRGAGLRHDRPIYLLREFPMPAGAHRVRVSFTRRETTDDDAAAFAPVAAAEADTGLYAGRADREAAEHARRARAAVPPRLGLDTTLTFAPRGVALVTFDAVARRLEVRTGPAASPGTP